jgi:2-polyprenyl-6-methoxyphenol hydroxylase-like FAD-dependent oxidoreductase
MPVHTPVLVVGGGLNGLTTALLLASRGVRCLVVERRPGTSIQYKFAGISPRSMEIFRGLGIEDEIRSRRTGDQRAGGIARAKTLADPDVQWMMESAWPDVGGLSETQAATCDQHVLEPILRNHAERRGADVRFGTELVSVTRHDDRVEALMRDRRSGTEETVHAEYLVAADGANGTLRERLGIGRTGPGTLQYWMNIIFDTDLSPFLQGKRFTSCFVTDLNATFTPRESGRWLLALQYDPERGDTPESFDADRCRELIRAGAGRPDARADLVDARSWEVAASVADTFRAGRAFLVGDAAHLMPPTGAFGGNTGIHDAHNLAWKLALVLENGADPALLDSYDSERRPVVGHTLDQALARLRAWFQDPRHQLPPPVEMVDGYDVIFGQVYRTGALVPEPDGPGRPFAPARELSGQPGTRAPHLPLERRGARTPIHDLFGPRPVLFASVDGDDWCPAAEQVGHATGIGIDCHRIGPGRELVEVEGSFPERYGITSAGAVLIRPDGFVRWRAREASRDGQAGAESALTDAVAHLLGARAGASTPPA